MVKTLLERERRKERELQVGIFPRTKGHPRIDGVPRDIVAEQIYKIQRMGMEKSVATGFLHLTERKWGQE